MKIYCPKCRSKTDTEGVKKKASQNGRGMAQGNCKACGCKKTQFVSQSGSGFDLQVEPLKIPDQGLMTPQTARLGRRAGQKKVLIL